MTSLLDAPTAAASIGRSRTRDDGPAKVTGTAPYAADQPVTEPAYLHPVQATVAVGRITDVDTSAAEQLDGVLAVLTHRDAPRLADTDDAELAVLQTDRVAFRGQFVGAVVAETPEVAREAAALVRVTYDVDDHDVVLRLDHPELYAPEVVNPEFPTDTDEGDVEAALAAADVVVDARYTTPLEHNNPMEPHATIARRSTDGGGDMLVLHDANQGAHAIRSELAPLLGLDEDRIHIVSPYVGGGFGAKARTQAHHVLVALAADRLRDRSVKLVLTRQQMFSQVGYRTDTMQRVRLGADGAGHLDAIWHESVQRSARIKEFAEQTTVGTRSLYTAAHRRTSHRLAPLDVPAPFWMRAPGEAPGMFALEVAMDELAVACGIDPIDLRERNDPAVNPGTGEAWSDRSLVDCLREGARRFGWHDRDPAPRATRRDGWWHGTGVATASYPHYVMPGSMARITYDGAAQVHHVHIGAADIGTGAWTALRQIAADALDRPYETVVLHLGDTDLPAASLAGGSSGTTSWGATIVAAGRAFLDEHGTAPQDGAATEAEMPEDTDDAPTSVHSFGAHFVEVAVHGDTGEIRVPRMLGVFAVGRIINPLTARSQLIGGMTWGLSMALHEQSVVDPRYGHVVNHDLADYHIAANADVVDLDAVWLERTDEDAGPLGSRGIGEIGIVGAAAAVANAAHHATGVRVRDLPLTADAFLD